MRILFWTKRRHLLPGCLQTILLTLCVLPLTNTAGAANADLLLLPSAAGESQTGGKDGIEGDDWAGSVGVDVFGTLDSTHFTALIEVLLASDEREVERAQAGIKLGQDTLWFGKFHNPIGSWNSSYHHGAFIQPTISRPGFLNFEEDGALVATHVTGFLLQGARNLQDHEFSFDVAVGLGPEYSADEESLEALDILNPNASESDYLATARVSYQEFAGSQNGFGIFANTTKIPVADSPSEFLKQYSLGAFLSRDWQPLVLTAEFQHLRTVTDFNTRNSSDTVDSVYLQLDYSLGQGTNIYFRGEGSHESTDSALLSLFPNFRKTGLFGGLRFQLGEQHLLKIEISKQRTVTGSYKVLALEWSAMWR
jgi:hypothetical protein